MPWTPIDRLPEDAKDGREVLVRTNDGVHYVAFLIDERWRYSFSEPAIHPTRFYQFENGKTMPDAPEGE